MLLPAAGAFASVEAPSALSDFASAYAADSFGAPEEAARRYAAALALSPDNPVLAAAAFRQAFTVGDKALAVSAARALQASGKLAPDGRLVLFADAVGRSDWKTATLQLDQLRKDPVFSHLTPTLEAWVRVGSKKGDPLAAIAAITDNPFAAGYASEHRPFLLLAKGRTKEGLAALTALQEAGPLPARLAIAAAGQLARQWQKAEALALLEGQAPALAAARARLQSGKRLRAGMATAPEGISELLLRLAADASAAEAPEFALTLSRTATFLAPGNAAPWLITAELLAAQSRYPAALAALRHVPVEDALFTETADLRLRILNSSGERDAAIAEARALVAAQPQSVQGWTRLADLLSAGKAHGEASEAYGKALDLVSGGARAAQPEWTLWLLRGGALTQAGRWAEGKAALEQAQKLAPDRAVVLNYLGYSQLERRENLAEAERLIREASKLQPDDPSITDSLGWAHYVRGDYPKAVELLERAARGQPADAAINEHLGDAYYSAGRRFEARYAWQAALTYAERDAAARLQAKIDTGLKPSLAAP
ncbi:MAG TPA: tetratricopeptide repeat protein [Allosphingosinicella sp.]|jgi:Flp pilus assembly protein TadD